MVKNLWSINNGAPFPSFFVPFLPRRPTNIEVTMASLQQMAEEIIEKRGGDAYKRAWLERWLSDPDNESEYLSLLLKKELNEAVKKKKDTSKPKAIKL